MLSSRVIFCVFSVLFIIAECIPMREDINQEQSAMRIRKRLSNEALIRLLMKNRGIGSELKRSFKRSEVDRRSLDDDFSNCFLSPVQCMLPTK